MNSKYIFILFFLYFSFFDLLVFFVFHDSILDILFVIMIFNNGNFDTKLSTLWFSFEFIWLKILLLTYQLFLFFFTYLWV